MKDLARTLKSCLPRLSEIQAVRVLQLDHQFRTYLLGGPSEEWDVPALGRLWSGLPTSPRPDGGEVPIELRVACFLGNPDWPGQNQLELEIRALLDQTMIIDELEEVRRLYLQNVFLDSDPSVSDVRESVYRDARWAWVLNPSWAVNTTREEKMEFLKLKYGYFARMGWIKDATPENPVIRFQMAYLSSPRLSLREIFRLDRAIQQGSEIFLRSTDVNPFLISYFYNCCNQGWFDLLSEFDLGAA